MSVSPKDVAWLINSTVDDLEACMKENDELREQLANQPKPATGATTESVSIGSNREKPATGMETELPTEIRVKIDPSLLPKPTGEWTAEELIEYVNGVGYHNLAIQINAALAASWRKGHADAQAPALKRIDELHQQLAAERSKYLELDECYRETLRDLATLRSKVK